MLVSVEKYSRMIGKSRHTVYRMIKTNRLPDGVTVTKVAERILIEVKTE